jgi:hypothetical protein
LITVSKESKTVDELLPILWKFGVVRGIELFHGQLMQEAAKPVSRFAPAMAPAPPPPVQGAPRQMMFKRSSYLQGGDVSGFAKCEEAPMAMDMMCRQQCASVVSAASGMNFQNAIADQVRLDECVCYEEAEDGVAKECSAASDRSDDAGYSGSDDDEGDAIGLDFVD